MMIAALIKTSIFSLVLLIVIPTHAQVNLIGRVSDGISGSMIKDVHVFAGDIYARDITSLKGRFSIRVVSLPVFLSFSHIGYHTKNILITHNPERVLEIELIPSAIQIEEVTVTGGRYQQYLKEEIFYVRDYRFSTKHIWLTGYPQKNIRNPELRVIDLMGKTLAKMAVGNRPELYSDAFDNIHLIESDSVFQLFIDEEIQKHYPRKNGKAFEDLVSLQFMDEKKAILKKHNGDGSIQEYVRYNFADSTYEVIHSAFNRKLFKDSKHAKDYNHGPIPDVHGSPGPSILEVNLESMRNNNLQISHMNDNQLKEWIHSTSGSLARVDGSFVSSTELFTNYAMKKLLLHKPIVSRFCKVDTSFIIFEDCDQLLWVYNQNLDLLDFYHIKLPPNASDLNLIQDKSTEKIYVSYRVNGLYLLGEINPLTGEVLKTIDIKGFAFVENIQIHRGRVYFTHQSPLGLRTMNLYSFVY